MFFLKFLDFVIWVLPAPFTMWLGRRLGTLFYLIDHKHRKICFDNIKHAFPEYSHVQIKFMSKRVFQHLILVGVETLILSRKPAQTLRDNIYDEGYENLEQAKKKGRSILFLTGHAGNWEVMARLGKWAGFTDSVVARDVKSPKVQKWIQSIRGRYGVLVISKGELRHIIHEFEKGGTVGAVIDQNGGTRGTFTRFFGRPASTPTGIIRLGLKSGIPILPVFLRRISDRFEFRCLIGPDLTEGLENLSLDEKEKITLERFTQSLEKFIREDPCQWLWLHRRWKTRPEGEVLTVPKRLLVLNDGKPGHYNQMLGVLRELAAISWKVDVCQIQFRSLFHRAVIYMMTYLKMSSIGVLRWALRSETLKEFPAWSPSFVLACGSIGASVAFFLKKYYGAKSIVLMRSGFPHVEKLFDLVILPLHDRPPHDSRVIPLKGIPTPITEEGIRDAAIKLSKGIGLSQGRKIGMLVGGTSRRLQMKTSTMQQLIQIIFECCELNHCQLLLATSRRTPLSVENIIRDSLGQKANTHLLFSQDWPQNPIPGILGLSDILIVTEDSFSMLMEAVHSGRPVITIQMPRRGFKAVKQLKTLQVLEKEGRIYRPDFKDLKEVLETLLKKESLPQQVINVETKQCVDAILGLVQAQA